MPNQRWGTFSVKDHTHTWALATDVLLYDRLVFPAPPKGDQKAREWWERKNWSLTTLREKLTRIIHERGDFELAGMA